MEAHRKNPYKVYTLDLKYKLEDQKFMTIDFIYDEKAKPDERSKPPRLHIRTGNNQGSIDFLRDEFGIVNPSQAHDELSMDITDYNQIIFIVDFLTGINSRIDIEVVSDHTGELAFIMQQCSDEIRKRKVNLQNSGKLLIILNRALTTFEGASEKDDELKNQLMLIKNNLEKMPNGIGLDDLREVQNHVLDLVHQGKIPQELKNKMCPELVFLENKRKAIVDAYRKFSKELEKDNIVKNKNADNEENQDREKKPERAIDSIRDTLTLQCQQLDSRLQNDINISMQTVLKPSEVKHHLQIINDICSDKGNRKIIRSHFKERSPFKNFLYKLFKILNMDSKWIGGPGRSWLFAIAYEERKFNKRKDEFIDQEIEGLKKQKRRKKSI